jgi:Cd2+/Zn2+-exporting ATPase
MTQSHSSHPPHSPGHAHGHAHGHEAAASPAAACGGCACSAGAGHDGHDHGALPGWPRIAAALALAMGAEAAHWLQQETLGMLLAVAAIALAGLGVYRAGLKDLARLRLGIHALMAVAVTGAFLIGQWPEAAMVMALYVAAERIEDGAMDRARNAIRSLLDLAPETADVLQPDGTAVRTPVQQVPLGARVRIAPGARVPLDGTVAEGESAVNQAPITGESQLADKAPGDPLYAGSVNQHGELLMQVTAPPSGAGLARAHPALRGPLRRRLHAHRLRAGPAAGAAGAAAAGLELAAGRLPGAGAAGHRLSLRAGHLHARDGGQRPHRRRAPRHPHQGR